MARPREFEPTEALDRAMYLFWQKGYQDTSMEDLVKATGVSRYGFYNTFGDKQDLFAKAITHYANQVIHGTLAPMEKETSTVQDVFTYFDNLLISMQESKEYMGCLIGNTAIEAPGLEEQVNNLINQHYTRMQAAFQNALQNSKTRGEISQSIDTTAFADFLVGVANGFLAGLRSGMSYQQMQHFFEVALVSLK